MCIRDRHWKVVENYDLAAHFRKQVREMESFDWLWGWAYFANAEYPDDPYVSNADCQIALNGKDGLTPLGKVLSLIHISEPTRPY